jgi:Zn-dependent protease with chaperone function
MIPAKFFDGKSAKARDAQVMILGSYLVIRDSITKNQINVDLAKLDVGHQAEFVVLSNADIEVHIAKADYVQLGHKPSFLGKDKKPIMQAVMISLGVGFLLYFFYQPLMKFAVTLIPNSIFENTAKQLTDYYKPQHCLTPDQEKNLEEIFARLGRNYSIYKVFVIKSEVVNAFVMPGNLIVIHDELLKTSPSPEAIAGIISHEMAHIEGEHIKISYIKNYVVETFSTFVLNNSVAVGILKQVVSGLFTQEEERRADEIAALNLKDQNISPKGMVTFFEQLKKTDPGYLKYINFSHPDYPDRIKVFSQVYDTYPVLTGKQWKKLQTGCK